MEDCIFCKIIAGKIPAEKIYEDDATFAFLDIHPNNKGHALVIPKVHYANIYEIPEKDLSAMICTVKRIAAALKRSLEADGINLGMNNEGAAGQLVFHAHMHVIPRFSDDGLRHWQGKSYDEGEITVYGEKIRKAVS